MNGREQIFEIEELKVRLAERQLEVDNQLADSQKKEKGIETRVLNAKDDIHEHGLELKVERPTSNDSPPCAIPDGVLRLVETRVWALDDGECSGEPQDTYSESVEVSTKSTSDIYLKRTGVLKGSIYDGNGSNRVHLSLGV